MQPARDSEFVDALRKGALIGLGLLVLALPPVWVKKHRDAQEAQRGAVVLAPQAVPGPRATVPEAQPPAVPHAPGVRLADFRGEDPSPDARLVANWVVHTRDAKRHAFVVVDKKDARVYVFGPEGRLKDSAPALLGAARGDDSYPGIGDKPLSQVRPEEKTTPAGRFVAEPGMNSGNEDVVWVSYDLAVSMHRIRPLHAREHRLERLASLTTDDNRISFGCINLPVSFYENVVAPTVKKYGAIVYVLPDVKTPQQVFGAWDVTDPGQLAAREATSNPLQQVSLQQVGGLPQAR
ncbi:hypothetical protein [Ramlibacter sp. AN1133]|uniref:hypothetical protein n=1 Tax=Ramlibacter sp. AN1133 TaxID=3133429 RepID=UPI0030BE4A09